MKNPSRESACRVKLYTINKLSIFIFCLLIACSYNSYSFGQPSPTPNPIPATAEKTPANATQSSPVKIRISGLSYEAGVKLGLPIAVLIRAKDLQLKLKHSRANSK